MWVHPNRMSEQIFPIHASCQLESLSDDGKYPNFLVKMTTTKTHGHATFLSENTLRDLCCHCVKFYTAVFNSVVAFNSIPNRPIHHRGNRSRTITRHSAVDLAAESYPAALCIKKLKNRHVLVPFRLQSTRRRLTLDNKINYRFRHTAICITIVRSSRI